MSDETGEGETGVADNINRFEDGLNKMYEWVGTALFEIDLPSNLREKITKRIAALRAEK